VQKGSWRDYDEFEAERSTSFGHVKVNPALRFR
jgi:hypothetical protein